MLNIVDIRKFYIIILGSVSTNHIEAINKIISILGDKLKGYSYIEYNDNKDIFYSNVENIIDYVKKENIIPIILKGYSIHTEDFIRPLIKYYKRDHKDQKFLLTHCAIFDDFILSDAALLTNYTSENILTVIKNAIKLKTMINTINNKYQIALLNAGGDTNFNTASENWESICKTIINYNRLNKECNFKIEISQLDSCLSSSIRQQKINNSSLPSIIIPSSINEGNSIWKSLTVIGKKTVGGIVMGIPMNIGLVSRTDTSESIFKTLEYLIRLDYTKEY